MSDRELKIKSFLEEMISMQKCIGASKDSFFKKFFLNRPQIEMLYLIEQFGLVSQKEISEKLRITSGAVTQLVDGLVELDFLERISDEKDRRVISLKFTKNGLKKYLDFKKEHLEKISFLLSDLTDEELETLIQIQKKIVNKHKKQNGK